MFATRHLFITLSSRVSATDCNPYKHSKKKLNPNHKKYPTIKGTKSSEQRKCNIRAWTCGGVFFHEISPKNQKKYKRTKKQFEKKNTKYKVYFWPKWINTKENITVYTKKIKSIFFVFFSYLFGKGRSHVHFRKKHPNFQKDAKPTCCIFYTLQF